MACAACKKQRSKLFSAARRGDVKGTVKATVQGIKMMNGKRKGEIVTVVKKVQSDV